MTKPTGRKRGRPRIPAIDRRAADGLVKAMAAAGDPLTIEQLKQHGAFTTYDDLEAAGWLEHVDRRRAELRGKELPCTDRDALISLLAEYATKTGRSVLRVQSEELGKWQAVLSRMRNKRR